jgi:CelD/BcsL family acetyltransferase involved in cellulose biosynthesis
MAKSHSETKKHSTRSTQFRDAARSTVEALESNPVAVVAGGIAVGLIAGALIPRGEREKEVLRPVGQRVADGAKAAFAAAKETGKEQFSGAVMGKDAAKDGARKVLESALGAARGAKSA